jgi:hypothetical protein
VPSFMAQNVTLCNHSWREVDICIRFHGAESYRFEYPHGFKKDEAKSSLLPNHGQVVALSRQNISWYCVFKVDFSGFCII